MSYGNGKTSAGVNSNFLYICSRLQLQKLCFKPMSEINLGAIQSIFDRYDTRQRLFQADLSRTTRKHSRKIRKETESLRLLRTQDKHKSAQDNRKQLFTTEMIGQSPPNWSLQLIPSYHQLPDLPRPEYYPTPNDIRKVFAVTIFFLSCCT